MPGTRPRAKKKPPQPCLLIGTIKGGFLLEADEARRSWKLNGPFVLGSRVHDFRVDPRDGKSLLMTSTGGHLGPTIYRSTNRGRTWKEAARPPRFAKATRKNPEDGKTSRGKSLRYNFWLEPGHAEEQGTWYAGTSPIGLFQSKDGGDSWSGVNGFNHNPMWSAWTMGGDAGTPDGSTLHSICVDPRDARHLYVSASSGGTFESANRGRSWAPINKGVAADFYPGPPPEYGHDPHCVVMHPADPDRLYQQNHCGIYRLDRDRGEEWDRIGTKMPKRIGDIGFPIVPHPTDPDTVWVFPMDGTRIWPRTSPGARPAVYRTRDGGRSWERQDKGLPPRDAYFTVKRQAMCADDDARRTGVYFGTTTGELWGSTNGGQSWRNLVRHLPHVYSVRFARLK